MRSGKQRRRQLPETLDTEDRVCAEFIKAISPLISKFVSHSVSPAHCEVIQQLPVAPGDLGIPGVVNELLLNKSIL